MDWSGAPDHWTGLLDWTTGLDYCWTTLDCIVHAHTSTYPPRTYCKIINMSEEACQQQQTTMTTEKNTSYTLNKQTKNTAK